MSDIDEHSRKIAESFAKMNFDPPEWAKNRPEGRIDGFEDELDTDEEDNTLVNADLGVETVGLETGQEEVRFTTEKLKERYAEALTFKDLGNAKYRKADYVDAAEQYRKAISILPTVPPRSKARLPPVLSGGITEITDDEAEEIVAESSKAPQERERDEIEDAIRELAATCCTNLAVCLSQQKEYAQAVQACSEALVIDPERWKALQKRAECNALLGSYTALQDSVTDYISLSERHPDAAQRSIFVSRLAKLRPKLDEAKQQETERMMTELKGYGNTLLGYFGMSLDNFKQTEGGGWTFQSKA